MLKAHQKRHMGKRKPSCHLTQEDDAVYAALVEALEVPDILRMLAKRNEILIADTTAAPRDVRSHFGAWGYQSKSKAAPGKDTVVDFERKAQTSCLLNSQFGDGKSYRVVTRGELDKAFKGGGWQDFYKNYPESGHALCQPLVWRTLRYRLSLLPH
jgi:hypothetical protein